MSPLPDWLFVFLLGMVTAIATGLGAAPLLLMRRSPERALGIANALAGGVMLGASFGLMHEGFRDSDGDALRTVAGMVAGLVFIVATRKLVRGQEELKFAGLQGGGAGKAMLLVAVMTLHSVTEGVGVGVAFGEGQPFGMFITAAIAVHNIPEGLAISLAMVPRGSSVPQAAWWSVVSSLPQPAMAVPAFLFVSVFSPWLPVGLGFAAGAMIWMVIYELIPEALEHASHNTVAISATLSLIVMQAINTLLGV